MKVEVLLPGVGAEEGLEVDFLGTRRQGGEAFGMRRLRRQRATEEVGVSES